MLKTIDKCTYLRKWCNIQPRNENNNTTEIDDFVSEYIVNRIS